VAVVDRRLTDTPSGDAIHAALAHAVKIARAKADALRVVELVPGDNGLEQVTYVVSQVEDADTVVGVGGGSVLDIVKLATAGVPHIVDYLRSHARRSGLVRLPTSVCSRRPRRVLVPTTVGTSSEVSRAACIVISGTRRLVLGAGLPPQVAVLDPAATASLPHQLFVEGIFEALMRVLGPYAGTRSTDPVVDRIAEATASGLLEIGNHVSAGQAAATDELRLQAARLSAYTQVGWVMLGRETYGAKVWFLANELATQASVRKVVATACVLPAVWRRILAGDARFGDAQRLVKMWRRLVGDHDPVRGIELLLRRWGIDSAVALDNADVEAVVDRLMRLWGGALPMLSGLTRDELRALIIESVADAAGATSRLPVLGAEAQVG